MGKTALGLQKEIAKKQYAESPLGKAEKVLREFYWDVDRGAKKVSDEEYKAIDAIRNDSGKEIEKYSKEQNEKIKKLMDERQAIIDVAAKEVDDMLLKQMEKEIEFINKIK
jgi:hypothetical protein